MSLGKPDGLTRRKVSEGGRVSDVEGEFFSTLAALPEGRKILDTREPRRIIQVSAALRRISSSEPSNWRNFVTALVYANRERYPTPIAREAMLRWGMAERDSVAGLRPGLERVPGERGINSQMSDLRQRINALHLSMGSRPFSLRTFLADKRNARAVARRVLLSLEGEDMGSWRVHHALTQNTDMVLQHILDVASEKSFNAREHLGVIGRIADASRHLRNRSETMPLSRADRLRLQAVLGGTERTLGALERRTRIVGAYSGLVEARKKLRSASGEGVEGEAAEGSEGS